MNGPEREEIVARLVSQWHYPAPGAVGVADRLTQLSPQLREAFAAWWSGQNEPEVEVEGYTFDHLVRGHGLNPIAAYLTLDWLARDPVRAREALQTGHDRIEGENTRPQPS